MAILRPSKTPLPAMAGWEARQVKIWITLVCMVIGLGPNAGRPLWAARPSWAWEETEHGTSTKLVERDAMQSLPMDKLDAVSLAKVAAVLNNVTVFRRLPVRVVSCDPALYLFVVRHPDVVVNIWEVLGVSLLQLRQSGPDRFRVDEKEGTTAAMEFLYHDRQTHVIYGDWRYSGPMMVRPVNGRCLGILKTSYLRDNDGHCYVTSRLDAFLSVEPGGVELLTKVFHPLVEKTADGNFTQAVAFVGSLSRTGGGE